MIGIVFSYLGFANADSYANEAQSSQLANIKSRVEQILQKEEYETAILQVIEQKRNALLTEIEADQKEKYAEHSLVVIDEYETKLKRSLSYYLSVLVAEKCDSSTISSFLGYAISLGLDMDTNLSGPYDAYFQEAARTYNVPAALLLAICKTESDFSPNVISGAGAIGLMQLMPETATSLGVSNPYDPYQNIMAVPNLFPSWWSSSKITQMDWNLRWLAIMPSWSGNQIWVFCSTLSGNTGICEKSTGICADPGKQSSCIYRFNC